jgi:hypothetical protein
MSRIRNAWRALMGRAAVQEVFAPSELTKGYQVTDWDYVFGAGLVHPYVKARRFYASCVQAYAENPGRKVEEVDLVKIGGNIYLVPSRFYLREVHFAPKPKRAKGAK